MFTRESINYYLCWIIGWDGMEWNGMVWNGMEWYGMVWNGMEWYGMVWNGMI